MFVLLFATGQPRTNRDANITAEVQVIRLVTVECTKVDCVVNASTNRHAPCKHTTLRFIQEFERCTFICLPSRYNKTEYLVKMSVYMFNRSVDDRCVEKLRRSASCVFASNDDTKAYGFHPESESVEQLSNKRSYFVVFTQLHQLENDSIHISERALSFVKEHIDIISQ